MEENTINENQTETVQTETVTSESQTETMNNENATQPKEKVLLVQKSIKPGLGCGIPSLILSFISFSFFYSHVFYPKFMEFYVSYLKESLKRPGYVVIADTSIPDRMATFFRPLGIGFGIISAILGIVGIILFAVTKTNGAKKGSAGLVLSIIGLVFGALFAVLCLGLDPMVLTTYSY